VRSCIPAVVPSIESIVTVAPSAPCLTQAEVEHLDEVLVQTEPANEDVGGFDVAVDQTPGMRLAQRVTDLAEE
jgi:hypothetical protein